MVHSFAQGVIRWRWLIVIATLLIVVGAGKGMRLLTLTTDYRVFFSEDNPQLTAFETLQNTYTKNDNLFIAIAPKDKKVFTRKTLEAIEKLTEEAWQVPYSIRVDSLSNFQHTRAEEDDLVVEDLYTDGANLLDSELQNTKEISLAEPLLVHRLISPRADVAGINITIHVPEKDPQKEIPEAVNFTRELVKKMKAEFPHLELHLTGTVMMNNAFPEAAKSDMRSLVPLMFLAIIALLWFLLRSAASIFTTVLVILFSIITAMGITGWSGVSLTPPSGNAPTIILTLAVAHCVHILVGFLHSMRGGKEKKDAMIESLRVNFQPVTLTSFTTAIGFLSMNFSDAPPFRDLGNMVAIGIIASWILAITFLPALMSLLPSRVKKTAVKDGRAMITLGDFVIRNRTWLFWGNLAIVVALAFSIPRNELNDQFVEYFDESIEFRRATDFLTENLTGIYTIDYSLEAGGSGDISEPDFLHKVEEFSEWYRRQPEVVHVNVITDIMKRLNKNLHGDDPAWYRIPDQRDLAAQYLLLYEMSLPYGLDLNNQINIDKSATRVSVTIENLTTNELLALEQRAREWLIANAPRGMQQQGASPAVMFAHITSRNIRSMLTGTSLALVMISVILIFAFRSVKIGAVSLLPNILPSVVAFGLWGLLVGEVGVSLSVVISMTLGIVVDDTIHFLSKYLRARREQNMSAEEAIRYAFSTVGTALWVTTIVLVAGFTILAMSAFKMNAGMGLMTAITITSALVLDFLFLPPLLMMIEGKKK